MAEFPELGEQCGWSDCRQLDFLPVSCSSCLRRFCQHHAPAHLHRCTVVPTTQTIDTTHRSQNFSCHVTSCEKTERVRVTCEKCQHTFCLSHRHVSDHNCEFSNRDVRAIAERTANQIQTDRLATPISSVVTGRSERARATAARVRLMRIKQRARGDQRISPADRLYLQVLPPGGEMANQAVFVNRLWSAGRVLDTLADVCGVSNTNHVTGSRRLALWLGGHVLDDLSAIIGDVAVNGEEIHIKYEQ